MLVQQRRAGGDDDPVQPQLVNILFDHLLARIGAHVFIIPGNGNIGQFGSDIHQLFDVHRAGDIRSAMADVNADFDVSVTVRTILTHNDISLCDRQQRLKIDILVFRKDGRMIDPPQRQKDYQNK